MPYHNVFLLNDMGHWNDPNIFWYNHKVLHEEMKCPQSEQLLLQGEGPFFLFRTCIVLNHLFIPSRLTHFLQLSC